MIVAMDTKPHDLATADIPMPRLSDDAIIQIHNFIAHFLDLFEARYGDQIHRYYDDRSAHSMRGPEPTHSIDDPPF